MTPEEAWYAGRPPKKSGNYTPKPRQLLGKAIIDTIEDRGKRHCYLTDRCYNSRELRKWSEHVTGDVWVHEGYFVHNAGPTSETYIYKGTWPIFEQSMISTQNLIGKRDVGFSPSQHSREIAKWLRISEPVREDLKKIILPHYHFIACRPQQHPHAYYFDIKSAYWHMVANAPSPRIVFNPNHPKHIGWKPLREKEYDRWKMLIESMGQHKLTRNAIIGNWVRGYNKEKIKHNRFRSGKVVPYTSKLPYSNLSTLGWFIVRLVYELCQEEYLVDSGMYAHVDCVITTNPFPTYWKQMNVHYRSKYEGALNLISTKAYQIGPYATQYYQLIYEPQPLPPGCISQTVRYEPKETKPYLLPRSDYIHTSVLPYWQPQEKPYKSPQLPPHNLRLRLNTIPEPNKPPEQPQWEELT